MRLTRNKIEYLADRILQLCQETPTIHVTGNVGLVLRAIEDAAFNNMQQEKELDEEVETLLQQHQNAINAENLDLSALRMKIKRELARKKGFIL